MSIEIKHIKIHWFKSNELEDFLQEIMRDELVIQQNPPSPVKLLKDFTKKERKAIEIEYNCKIIQTKIKKKKQ